MRAVWVPLLLVALPALGCDAPADPPAPDSPALREEGPPEAGQRLNVPPEQLHRARREALGFRRMTEGVRAQTLSRRRAEPSPTYAQLRADAEAHARERATFEGRVGLSRPAGRSLWIVALHTGREGDEWRDPLYVLSVVDPSVSAGSILRVDGWVVGERTIGRHALPLVLAYHVEPTGG